MFCSTVIPTIGRPLLERAVDSLLKQDFAAVDYEVIVVNDSGKPLPPASWQQSGQVQVISTQRHERSWARNTGAAVARGQYLHFLDDDDWLLPGALQSFWELSQTAEADWLYGGSQLVDRQGQSLIQLHHGMNGNVFTQVMAGEWIPLQASLISARAFFAVGGFNPLITGPEDIDLCRRIALHGPLAGTPTVVAAIGMGLEDSTTDYNRSPELARRTRERILDEPGVFARLLGSAGASEWRGRMVRIYLTSAVWNLRRRRVFTAASRLAAGAAGFLTAGGRLLSGGFWKALKTSYTSETFLKGFQEAGRPVEMRPAKIGGFSKESNHGRNQGDRKTNHL